MPERSANIIKEDYCRNLKCTLEKRRDGKKKRWKIGLYAMRMVRSSREENDKGKKRKPVRFAFRRYFGT